MKTLLTVLCIILSCFDFAAIAQTSSSNTAATKPKTVELSEVVIKNYGPQTFRSRVRSENIHLVFNGPTDPTHHCFDSTYFLTRFQKLDDRPVKLSKVNCRLKPFDTTLFTLQLVLFQVVNGDSQLHVFNISNANDIQKKKLVVNLSAENLQIEPGAFFLGYGFVAKNRKQEYHYRIYSTTNGEGIMLQFDKGRMLSFSGPEMPCTFPFEIVYLKR